jgi:hypothetical protein
MRDVCRRLRGGAVARAPGTAVMAKEAVMKRPKAIGTVGRVLVMSFAAACGGGTPTAPSSPSAPATTTPTPTPSTVTVYASNDNRVAWVPDDPKTAETVVQGGVVGVGWQTNEYGTVGTGGALKFDFASQTAGRIVKKATFRLYVTDVPPPEVTVRPQIRVNAFASPWDPAALTWNIWAALECHATGEAQAPAPSGLGALDFDVTTIVQNWASGTWPNYGLKLMVDKPDPAMMPRIGGTWFQSLEVYSASTARPQIIIEFQ